MCNLTVAIPTYNRPIELIKVLNSLLSQLNENINIVIIDNCSDTPIDELLIKNSIASDSIKVYRNNLNIGLGPNLIRALEYSTSDWIWLLGDDDIPNIDSIEKISSCIRKNEHEDICLIKFNSDAGGKLDNDLKIINTNELAILAKNPEIYSNLLFISNSIFNKTIILKQISLLYKFAGSLAPHIPAIIASVKNGHAIIWLNDEITSHGRPKEINGSWDLHLLRTGFLSFVDIDFDDDFINIAMPSIYEKYVENHFVKNMFLLPYRTRAYSSNYWKRYFFKMSSIYSGFKMYYLLFCGIIISLVFRIGFLHKYLIKRVGKTRVGNFNRS